MSALGKHVLEGDFDTNGQMVVQTPQDHVIERSVVVTASARTRPLFTIGIDVKTGSKTNATSPPINAVIAGVLPLYGTWVILMSAISANCSMARCVDEPCPAEP